MITRLRDRAPAVLIPSAWLLTLVTVGLTEVTTYWIEHMHYFITLFLGIFLISSWKDMGENSTIKIWRNIMLLGIISTAAGSYAFYTQSLSQLLWVPLVYWAYAPAVGTFLTAQNIEKYRKDYLRITYEIILSGILIFTGFNFNNLFVLAIGLIGASGGQTLSLLKAVRIDNKQ